MKFSYGKETLLHCVVCNIRRCRFHNWFPWCFAGSWCTPLLLWTVLRYSSFSSDLQHFHHSNSLGLYCDNYTLGEFQHLNSYIPYVLYKENPSLPKVSFYDCKLNQNSRIGHFNRILTIWWRTMEVAIKTINMHTHLTPQSIFRDHSLQKYFALMTDMYRVNHCSTVCANKRLITPKLSMDG